MLVGWAAVGVSWAADGSVSERGALEELVRSEAWLDAVRRDPRLAEVRHADDATMCVVNRWSSVSGLREVGEQAVAELDAARAAGELEMAQHASRKLAIAVSKTRMLVEEATRCAAPDWIPPPPPQPPPAVPEPQPKTPGVRLPLRQLSWSVEVSGPLALIELTQTFHNDADHPIDATYLFPVGPDAVVDGMWMRIGDRTVQSEVERRDRARERFEEARLLGRAAALTEQQRPNVFTQEVANIDAGADIEVTLRLVQPLGRTDGAWELVVPLVVAPRFAEDPDLSDVGADYFSAEELREGCFTGVDVDVELAIHAGNPLLDLWSPTHALHPTVALDDATLALHHLPPTRDLVVRWRTTDREPAMAVLRAGDHAMLLVEPPRTAIPEERAPRDLIWVVDTSCSMRGPKLELAKEALRHAILEAGPHDGFELVTFASRVATFSPRPVPLSGGYRNQALRAVDELTAVGTSQLWSALDVALALPSGPGRRKEIVFLTDGQVANDEQVLARVAGAAPTTVSTIGFGAAPNRYLLDEMARLGGGTSSYATLEDPGAEIDRIEAATDRAVLGGLAVDWGACDARDLAPVRAPDLRPGVPVRILARVDPGCSGSVAVTAWTVDGWRRYHVPIVDADDPRALASTWARERVADLERAELRGDRTDVSEAVAELGMQWGIVTSQTSLLAVDTDRRLTRMEPGEPIDQSLQLPSYGPSRPPGTLSRPSESGRTTMDWVTELDPPKPDPPTGQDSVALADRGAGTGGLHLTPAEQATCRACSAMGLPLRPEHRAEGRPSVEVRAGGSVGSGQLGPSARLVAAAPVGVRWDLQAQGDLGMVRWADRDLVRGSLGAGFARRPVHDQQPSQLRAGIDVERATAEGVDSTVTSSHLGGALLGNSTTSELDLDLHTARLGDDDRFRIGGSLAEEVVVSSRASIAGGLGLSGTSWDGHPSVGLASVSAEARGRPTGGLELAAGLAGAVPMTSLAPPIVAPSATFVWHASRALHLELGGGRVADTVGLAPLDLAPIPAGEEAHLRQRVDVSEALTLELGAMVVHERTNLVLPAEIVPIPDVVATVERTRLEPRVSLTRELTRRWSFDASWRGSWVDAPDDALLDDPITPFVPGFLDPYRRHRFDGHLAWSLPTDPWTLRLDLAASWASAIDDRWAAATTVWAGASQDLPTRRGHIRLTARLGSVADPSVVPLQLVAVDPTTPPAAPLRAEGFVGWTL
ncbi:MAG: VWA domain-containing protein [Alphaproteobacteria bacterium]|nr:VWA domain-containing protein [Alphaproteobacteria bacterium]